MWTSQLTQFAQRSLAPAARLGAARCWQPRVRAGLATAPATLKSRNLDDILQNNKEWVKSKPAEYFQSVGKVHKPKYMWIGCSDARVPANEIMGLGPGEVFVHRNVANMVVSSDLNLLTVLQYAVAVLKVEHIIVCGHYDCGGVRASVNGRDEGLLENWLTHIRDVARLHYDELKLLQDPEAFHRRLVELNVIEQCMNLFKTGVVQRARKLSQEQAIEAKEPASSGGQSPAAQAPLAYPRVHGLVFNPSDGVLHRLPTNFKERTQNYNGLYDLY